MNARSFLMKPVPGELGDSQMKKLALAAALSIAATSAFAGGMAEPIMDETPVVQEASSSAGGIVVPLILLLLVAAAASN